MAEPAHCLQIDPDPELLTCLTTMDLSGDQDYWLDLVTVTGLELFHLVQVLWDSSIATKATTLSCDPWLVVSPGRAANPCCFLTIHHTHV